MTKKRGKGKVKAKKVILGIMLAYILIMGIGYLGVSYFYSSHFCTKT